MNNVKQFNNFQTSFKRLKENDYQKFFIHFYHHDFNSEPFLHIDSYTDSIRLEHISDYGLLITIVTPEVTLVFTEINHFTNISGDAVVFSSKHDDETYCIIEVG